MLRRLILPSLMLWLSMPFLIAQKAVLAIGNIPANICQDCWNESSDYFDMAYTASFAGAVMVTTPTAAAQRIVSVMRPTVVSITSVSGFSAQLTV